MRLIPEQRHLMVDAVRRELIKLALLKFLTRHERLSGAGANEHIMLGKSPLNSWNSCPAKVLFGAMTKVGF